MPGRKEGAVGRRGRWTSPVSWHTAVLTDIPPNLCRKLSGNEDFEGKWGAPDKAEGGAANQHPVSSTQAQPSLAIPSTLECSHKAWTLPARSCGFLP